METIVIKDKELAEKLLKLKEEKKQRIMKRQDEIKKEKMEKEKLKVLNEVVTGGIYIVNSSSIISNLVNKIQITDITEKTIGVRDLDVKSNYRQLKENFYETHEILEIIREPNNNKD